MSTNKINVVFTVAPAEVVSKAAAGRGYLMKGYLVTGVKVGSDKAMMFTPRRNDEWRRTGPTWRLTYKLSVPMAERLRTFVETCLVQNQSGFDGYSFMRYLCGLGDSPFGEPSGSVCDCDHIGPEGLSLGAPFIGTLDGSTTTTSGISLADSVVLSVTGADSALVICDLEALLKAYGGARAYKVTI